MAEDHPNPVDAKASIDISAGKLSATITLEPPRDGGRDLNLHELTNLVNDRGITNGVKLAQLKSLALSPVYNEPVVIAEGENSVDGDDAYFEFHIRLERDLKPKERPDGSVDFKELGLIESVKQGTLLCEKHMATPGKQGCDIFGNYLPVKPGRDKNLPVGKNTVQSDDKLKLFAEIDGQVEFINNKLNVFNTFNVSGDVSPATGNIVFPGNVVITGGVLSGFSVQAAGNVDIGGIVEAAHIISGGSLIIRGGYSGGETGVLDVGGDLTCRFIQGGKVTVEGDLETTYIMNSNVTSGGAVNLTGKGLIVGGKVTARTTVTASTLGSAGSGSTTVVEVGNDAKALKRSHELPLEMEDCEKKIKSAELLAKKLLQAKNMGVLTPESADNLKKTLRYIKQLKTLMLDLEMEYEVIQMQLENASNSMVKVRQIAYPGVKIIIGAEQFPLKSQYSFTSFRRTRSGIACSPLK